MDAKDYERLRAVFGERVMALKAEAGHAYRVYGGLESMIFRVFAKADPWFVGQEFGTYSGIKVIHALREENRWHHHGAGDVTHSTKLALRNTFNPDDDSWRQAVLQRGQDLLSKALGELTHDR